MTTFRIFAAALILIVAGSYVALAQAPAVTPRPPGNRRSLAGIPTDLAGVAYP